MRLLSRAMSAFAPETMLKREVARRRLEALRSGVGASVARMPQNIFQHQATKDNPYSISALRSLLLYVVGQGIKPHSKDKRVERFLKDWADTKTCDYTGEQNLYGLQALMLRHLVVDGEVFIRKVASRDGLKLQLLASSQLSHMELDNGQKIAFHFHDGIKTVGIPAGEIIHLFDKQDVAQTQGRSWLAPSSSRLKDLDEYEATELTRQKIAACFVGFYRDLEGGLEDPFSSRDGSPKELSPGAILKAPSGQTIEFASPPQPVSYGPYVENSRLTLSAALGVPYMLLTGDYSKANYSSSRMAMLNFYKLVEMIQHLHLLPAMKSLEAWLLEWVELKGIKPADILWALPRKEFIDPVKDIEGHKEAVASGFRSHSSVIRELGEDPEDVYQEIHDNEKTLKKIGLKRDA